MKRVITMALLAGACIASSQAVAQDGPTYLHCVADATSKSAVSPRIDVHYRLDDQGFYRFSDTHNQFWTPCNNKGSHCTLDVKDATITLKHWMTFVMMGERAYYETTTYISRYTGSFSEWTFRLDAAGKVIYTDLSSYSGACRKEESPEVSERKF